MTTNACGAVHTVVALYERRSHTGDGRCVSTVCSNAKQPRLYPLDRSALSHWQPVSNAAQRCIELGAGAVHHHPIHCTARTLPQLKSCGALRCGAFHPGAAGSVLSGLTGQRRQGRKWRKVAAGGGGAPLPYRCTICGGAVTGAFPVGAGAPYI